MRRERLKTEQLKSSAIRSEIEREQLIEQNFNLAFRDSPFRRSSSISPRRSPEEVERIRRIRSSSLPPVLYRQQQTSPSDMRGIRRSPRARKGRRSVSQSPRTRSPMISPQAAGENVALCVPPLPPKMDTAKPDVKAEEENTKPSNGEPSEEKPTGVKE